MTWGFVRRILGVDDETAEQSAAGPIETADEPRQDPASGAFRWLAEHRDELAAKDGWVAIASDRGVIARGATRAEVLAKLKHPQPNILIAYLSREPRVAF